ncbi:LuxR C-terminal-related transcriptional regulator [Microbulbifer harenosus]|uniref:Helix-turn-helix transcriptional regulator n=1 Tax=Microbulbifer harenosus TaxID=2576840 RepID=A0ABY2ULP6_9GAMM|nr:LuxR C-terminal-related transcriptional regulator [Microbulbifer harenosus]TLM79128.1 helix-turn-helix transcriptional regulator [Microbulbifer harenosus]
MEPEDLQPEKNLIHRAWRNVPDFFARQDISLPHKEIDEFIANTFSTGAAYYYVLDFLNIRKPMLVSNSVERILGLDPTATTIQSIIERGHPEDLPFAARAEETALRILNNQIGREQVRNYKISYCGRLRTRDGSYRMFNHQALVLATDEANRVAKVLSIHTDISHITNRNNYKLSLLHLFGGESFLNIDVFDENNQVVGAPSLFSGREIQIVRMLAEGKTSVEMAEILGISQHTVKNHRKNILKKAGCKTTGQLVSKVLAEGLV